MKKIEKFFKNINIPINEKHKEETKNRIFEFYQPAKRSFNLFNTLRFASLSAACVIIVSITIIGYSDKLGFYKKLTSPSTEEYEKINTADKESDDRSEGIIVRSSEEESKKGYSTDKKIIPEDFDALKSEKSVVMAPKKVEDMEGKFVEEVHSADIEPSANINSIKLENTNIDRLDAVKSSEIKKDEMAEISKSKRSLISGKEEESGKEFSKPTLKMESETQEGFINTTSYNKISFKPNKAINSFYYLNNQLSQNLAVDHKIIKNEEVINFFTKEEIAKSRAEVFIEGSLKSGNFYYILINLEPKEYLIKDLSITFNSNVLSYNIYGYSNDIGKNNIKSNNIIKNNHASIFLILQIENLNEEIARLEITKKKDDDKIDILQKKITVDNIKDINSVGMMLKKAILGYMILNELQSKEFTKKDIIEYKNKSIPILPADVEILYENYINFKRN